LRTNTARRDKVALVRVAHPSVVLALADLANVALADLANGALSSVVLLGQVLSVGLTVNVALVMGQIPSEC
jgi:hypothetical protein